MGSTTTAPDRISQAISPNPEVWKVDKGYIAIPTGPGLGIEVDEKQVRELSKDSKAWVSPGFIGPGGEIREW